MTTLRLLLLAFAFCLGTTASAQSTVEQARQLSDSQLQGLLLQEIGQDRYDTFAEYHLNKDILRKAHHFNLSDAEMIGLLDYTVVGSSEMNMCLRDRMSDSSCDGTIGQIEATTRALSHLPDYQGEVIRTVTLSPEELATYVSGATVTYDSFTSTSIQPNRVYGAHKLVIQSRHGKDISWASEFPDEKEVLFAPGAVFKITRVSASNNQKPQLIIFMQEDP